MPCPKLLIDYPRVRNCPPCWCAEPFTIAKHDDMIWEAKNGKIASCQYEVFSIATQDKLFAIYRLVTRSKTDLRFDTVQLCFG